MGDSTRMIFFFFTKLEAKYMLAAADIFVQNAYMGFTT